MIDTNVLISAIISEGIPYKIFHHLIAEKKITVHLSFPILNEYLSVLSSSKFIKYTDFHKNSQIILLNLYKVSTVFYPDIQLNIIKDFSDNKFLELAVFSNTDYIITGNTRDFNFEEYKGVKIITPTQYWNFFWKK